MGFFDKMENQHIVNKEVEATTISTEQFENREIKDPTVSDATNLEQGAIDQPIIDQTPETILSELVDNVIEGLEQVHVDTNKIRLIVEESPYLHNHHHNAGQHVLHHDNDINASNPGMSHVERNVLSDLEFKMSPSTGDHQDSLDTLAFVSKEKEQSPPHTLTGLICMVAILIHFTFFRPFNQSSFEEDVQSGVIILCLVFLFYCTLQFQDGEVTRPHPVVWRFVHGVILLYFMFLVLLLSQSSAKSIDIIMQTLLDRNSGTAPLPKYDTNEYSQDCSLKPKNVFNKVYDIYFFAHLFGWIAKALILRNWGMMWTCSIMFEIMEITLQKALPNFQECWWDRWLLDIFGCNLLGMYIGMKIVNLVFHAPEFDWEGSRSKRVVNRVMKFAAPKTFPKRFEWHTFSSSKRFGISFLIMLIILSCDVNWFLLKSSLQIPSTSMLQLYRILFLLPAGYASICELYAFAEDRSNRIGRMAWVLISLALLELMLAMKNFHLRQSFDANQKLFDEFVMGTWACTVIASALIGLVNFFPSQLTHHMGNKAVSTMNVIGKAAIIIPLGTLLIRDLWVFGGMKQMVFAS